MDSSVEKILVESGWKADRAVNIDKIKEMYDKNGYIYNQLQLDFISQFAYLDLSYEHPVWNKEIKIIFDPITVQESVDMDLVKEYEEYFEESFLLVGEIERENMTVFMGLSGELYGAFDDCVIKWGKDFTEMLHKLINGIKGELVVLE